MHQRREGHAVAYTTLEQAVGPAVLMQVKLGSRSDRYRALAWEQHRAQMVSQQLGTKQYTALRLWCC